MGHKFHTEVEIPDYPWKTGYGFKNLFMGSCFTENIGTRMAEVKFPVDINPFGILYNPASVAEGLRILMNERFFTKDDLVQHDGMWHSFAHHGRFSSVDIDLILENINDRIAASSKFLKETGFLFITFGTAWIYRYKTNGQMVSNCHKIPAGEFVRERLNTEAIVNDYIHLLYGLKTLNPALKVIFTVSPIRHWSDGAIENQISKAILLLAIDEIVKRHNGFCSYFPAYEIVMDELRDYRYYSPDMIHISDVAVDQIWEKFEDSLINAESKLISTKVQKIIKAASHRPLHPGSSEFKKFINQMLLAIE